MAGRRRREYKLQHLLAAICLLGLALGFLRHVTLAWGPNEVIVFTLAVLLATNILGWFQGARWQVFWIGFAGFGLAYWFASLGSAAEHLPTSWLLDDLFHRLHPSPIAPRDGDAFGVAIVGGSAHGRHFRAAGHAVFSLFFGLLGAVGMKLLVPAKRKGVEEVLPPDGSLLAPGWRQVLRDDS